MLRHLLPPLLTFLLFLCLCIYLPVQHLLTVAALSWCCLNQHATAFNQLRFTLTLSRRRSRAPPPSSRGNGMALLLSRGGCIYTSLLRERTGVRARTIARLYHAQRHPRRHLPLRAPTSRATSPHHTAANSRRWPCALMLWVCVSIWRRASRRINKGTPDASGGVDYLSKEPAPLRADGAAWAACGNISWLC